METALDVLKGLSHVRVEIGVLEQRIIRQKVEMQGLSSVRITDMPRSPHLPEGLDRIMAAKDALELEQRKSIAKLYERMRSAELILQEEDDPDMRVMMRLYYVEEKPFRDVFNCMYISKAKACRINAKIREKYEKQKLIPGETK
jgi:DNA-directed RNA polymerase specialized sigma subunit